MLQAACSVANHFARLPMWRACHALRRHSLHTLQDDVGYRLLRPMILKAAGYFGTQAVKASEPRAGAAPALPQHAATAVVALHPYAAAVCHTEPASSCLFKLILCAGGCSQPDEPSGVGAGDPGRRHPLDGLPDRCASLDGPRDLQPGAQLCLALQLQVGSKQLQASCELNMRQPQGRMSSSASFRQQAAAFCSCQRAASCMRASPCGRAAGPLFQTAR